VPVVRIVPLLMNVLCGESGEAVPTDTTFS